MTPPPLAVDARVDSHPEPFIVGPQDYPRPLNVVGEHITVLASGAATGAYEILLHEGAEGSGPPPHSHPWDESFYVIAGEVDFGVGDRRRIIGPGTLVHIPAGTTHWFRHGVGGARMMAVTGRLGASMMFADIDREIPPDRPDVAKLVEVGARHGLDVAV